MSGKSSPEFQWTDDEIQLLLEATQNLKDEDYKILSQTNCKFMFWCFYIQLFRFIKRNFYFFIKDFTKPL